MDVSRRDLFKGGAAIAAGLAASVGIAACTPKPEPEPEPEPTPTPDPTPSPEPAVEYMDASKSQLKWSFEIPPAPITDDQIRETVTAELVVIGAGTSGLVTANSAIDKGMNVLLFSASSEPCARGGSNNAIYSKAMKAAGLPKVDPWYLKKEILANHNAVDQKKWSKYYNCSEEATNWMIDIMEGAGFYTALEQNNYLKLDDLYSQPVCSHSWVDSIDATNVSSNQRAMVNYLAKRLVEKGGRLFYKMAGYQLVREGNNTGRVTAVIARNLEDNTYTKYVGTKAIVMAAGDFSADRDMMYKYCGPYANMITDEAYDREVNYDVQTSDGGLYKGDMHKAALWIGAAWQKSLPNAPMIATRSGGALSNRYQNFAGLLLDRDGERFMNEYSSRALGPLTQSMQAEKLVYSIWDVDWVNAYEIWPVNNTPYQKIKTQTKEEVIAGWDKNVADGKMFKADTIEDLVKAAGLPQAALDSIKRYNQMCEAGLDTDYYKDPDYLRAIKTPPFYCQKTDFNNVSFLTVLGGPRTNANMQVCDENDNPIPGLYAVGSMIGDMFAGIYTFMICGANYGAACLTMGYLTGKYIAENE